MLSLGTDPRSLFHLLHWAAVIILQFLRSGISLLPYPRHSLGSGTNEFAAGVFGCVSYSWRVLRSPTRASYSCIFKQTRAARSNACQFLARLDRVCYCLYPTVSHFMYSSASDIYD